MATNEECIEERKFTTWWNAQKCRHDNECLCFVKYIIKERQLTRKAQQEEDYALMEEKVVEQDKQIKELKGLLKRWSNITNTVYSKLQVDTIKALKNKAKKKKNKEADKHGNK